MSETVYALYTCFKATRAFRDLDLDDAAQEIENLVKGWNGEVTVRGVYSTVGFRADTDLLLWLVGPSPDSVQDAIVAFRRTRAGRELEVTWSFMGVVKPAEFTPDHAPAFVKGEPPRRYLCAYPFVRTEADGVAADAVVLATPAFVAAGLIRGLDPGGAAQLNTIPYASTGVVLLVYPEGTADALPEATGFVAPRGRAPMTACTFLSRKWPEPAFGTRAVVRCFVGAVGFEDVLDAPDEDIVRAVCRHLAAVLPLPDRAAASAVVRWPRSMPQFELGHLERVREIDASLPPGIVLAGNAYRGVGVADAVRSAGDAAERVRAYLAGEGTGVRGAQ